MESALYDPADGFYARGPRIGRGGAFATVPTLVPLFARALAADLRVRGRRSAARIRSPSARSARVTARSPRAFADALRDLPLDLVLCERSAGLAALQRARLPQARHVTLDELGPITGVLIANEVHDAVPGPRAALARRAARPRSVTDGRFVWTPRRRRPPTCGRSFARSGAEPAEGAELQVAPAQAELQTRLAVLLRTGSLHVFDYGEAGPERYLRRVPRLRTYLGGGQGGDPLSAPGSQDITVDVDFGAIRRAGEAAGLRTVVDEQQPAWLRRHGALEEAAALPAESERRHWLESLARDDAVGASFRVLVQERP